MADDRMIGIIKKLLTRAENTSTPEAESESCRAKAIALITKYNIDRALLEEHQPEQAEPVERSITVLAPYAVDKSVLLNVIAKTMRCELIHAHTDRGGMLILAYGFPSDLDHMNILFASLLQQITNHLARPSSVSGGSSLAAYRRSFIAGFTNAVKERLGHAAQDAIEQHTQYQPGADLVLADRRQRVTQFFRSHHPNTLPGRPRRLTGGGIRDGFRAGQNADLATDPRLSRNGQRAN